MQIYLPIAELSVNVFLLLGLGGLIGFLSGLFGVGGGFLMTPMLIFIGIPPAIAVATQANQVIASSISGVLAHWRRGNVDIKMGLVLLAGGFVCSTVGVALFTLLRGLGQIDLVISLSYVILLSTIGVMLLFEGTRALVRRRRNVQRRKLHQHHWAHGLPLKMRFRKSRLYISALLPLGSKSGSRTLFREAGVAMPPGFENLRDEAAVADALARLKAEHPRLRRAVVKLNEGFSGEGNAILCFDDAPDRADLTAWTTAQLPRLAFEAQAMTWDAYRAKIKEMGAIVEAFIEGADKRSPSAQYRIDPLGRVDVISTHDQVLGGNSNQIFLGCRFPADEAYRLTIQEEGMKAARLLADRGVLGRFGVDFISVPDGAGWRHYGIEINLRKGGTTHPFLMLQFLTAGAYDPATGIYRTPAGQPCYYHASDNLEALHYRGLTPGDLIDIAVINGLHFHGATQQGVVFHLIGALSEFGKLGLVCVGDTQQHAARLYQETVAILDREGGLS